MWISRAWASIVRTSGSVLTRYPDIFGFKIEGTISTSAAYLTMLGVNPRRMGYILTEMPQILGLRVGNNIKRKVDFLCSFGLSQSAIAKIIETRPYFLRLDLADQMRPVVDSLIELGLARDAISHVITQFPDILSLDVKRKLAARLTWLTSDVGVSAEDMGALIAKMPQILVINTTKASARVEFLKQAGFPVATMVRNCPQLLAASIDKSLKPNLEYLVSKMDRKLEEVVEFPSYLLYNVDETVRPRHEAILEKGIECSLAWMFNCTEEIFQQRLNVEYVVEEGNHDAELDVPYIVTRRTRLTDDETEAGIIVPRRMRLMDNASEDDAQTRCFQ